MVSPVTYHYIVARDVALFDQDISQITTVCAPVSLHNIVARDVALFETGHQSDHYSGVHLSLMQHCS